MSYDAFPAHESTRKRRRWGCTCGCLMVLIILLVGGSLVFYLGMKPFSEPPRYALIDETVNGYGVFRYNPDDNGVKELTSSVFQHFQESEKAELSENNEKILSKFTKYSQYFVNNFIHKDTTVLFKYDEEMADEHVVVAIPLKNRLAGVMQGSLFTKNFKMKETSKVDGATIYSFDEDGTSKSLLALSARNLMYSDNAPFLTEILKHSEEKDRTAEASSKLQTYIDELGLDQPPQGEDFAIAFVNAPSRILNLILAFEDWVGVSGIADNISATMAANQVSFDNIAGLKLTGDLTSADKLKLEITLYCHQAEMAVRLANVLKQSLPSLTKAADQTSLAIKADSRTRGNSVLVSVDISGIQKLLNKAMPATVTEPTSAN